MSNYLLIDLSYSIFFRYFATKRWYSFAHREDKFDENYEWFDNEIFKSMYTKKFFDSFSKIIKKYDIPDKNIIFIRDCPRLEIWRMAYDKNYKANREEAYGSSAKVVFKGGPFFKYTYDIIIPNLIEKLSCKMLKSDNLEADDVIAITKDFIRKRNPDSKIIIVTSDMDLLQLIDDNTTLISLKNKILNEKSCGDPKKDLEIKIICGDSSDNIPGCFQRCGHKTALKLINDKSKLLEKFKKEEGSMDRYAINRILIDFENIPNELVKNVTNKIIEQNV